MAFTALPEPQFWGQTQVRRWARAPSQDAASPKAPTVWEEDTHWYQGNASACSEKDPFVSRKNICATCLPSRSPANNALPLSQSQIKPVTDRRPQAVSWKATVLMPAKHISIYYNALEVLKPFSLRSLEAMSTKGIYLLIMFLWAAWVVCKQFNIHCCIPLLLYFLEDCLGNTKKKMTVIKAKLQYTIAFLWTLCAANTNRLEKLIQWDPSEKQSSTSKTIPLTCTLLNNRALRTWLKMST